MVNAWSLFSGVTDIVKMPEILLPGFLAKLVWQEGTKKLPGPKFR
jgi:hypothetical protein